MTTQITKTEIDAVLEYFGDNAVIGRVFKKLGKGNLAAINRQKVLYYWLQDYLNESIQEIVEEAEWEVKNIKYPTKNIEQKSEVILLESDKPVLKSPAADLIGFLFDLIPNDSN